MNGFATASRAASGPMRLRHPRGRTCCPWRSLAVVGGRVFSVCLGVFVVWFVCLSGRRGRRLCWVCRSRADVCRFLLRLRAARRFCCGRVTSAADWCARFRVPRGSLRWLWRWVCLGSAGRVSVSVCCVSGGRLRSGWLCWLSFGARRGFSPEGRLVVGGRF